MKTNKILNYIKNNKDKSFDYLGLFILIISFLVIHINFYLKLEYMLDSDISSELCLANLLNNERSLISKNWYYSTEIRIIYSQLIFAPLFSIFNSWKLVRVFGTVLGNILLLISFVYMCKTLNIKHIPWLCVLLICPISKDYYDFVLTGFFYTFNIIISFVSISLFYKIINKQNTVLHYIFLYLLCFLSSMGSIRQFVILYFPLLCSVVLYIFVNNKNYRYYLKPLLSTSIASALFSLIGYSFFNIFLSNAYSINNEFSISFGLYFEHLNTVINGWLNLLGFNKYVNMTILKYLSVPLFVLVTVIFMFLCIYVFIKILKNDNFSSYKIIVVLYFFISSLVVSSIFIVSSMYFNNRYFIPCYVFFIPVLGLLIEKINNYISYIILFVFVVFSISNTTVWLLCDYNDCADDFINIKDKLCDEKVYDGYATFWSANVLREISNGQIDTWCYGDNVEFDADNRYHWLQEKTKDYTSPKGKIFIIIDNEKKIANDNKLDKYCSYKGDYYTLFIIDDKELIYFNQNGA